MRYMKTKTIEWVLRIAVAGEFIGHGMFAIQGKKEWVEWFAEFGITDPVLALKIMFLIGLLDMVLGIIVLVKPIPIAVLWMAIWGFWTALVRPIVGASFWDFVERWANWGAPLALLLMLDLPKTFKEWLGKSKFKSE